MANFGMMLLMGGGLSSRFEILGESSLALLSELSGVLVVGCRWEGLGVSGVLVLGFWLFGGVLNIIASVLFLGGVLMEIKLFSYDLTLLYAETKI
mgnify:CR=1 FL=1